RGRLLANGRRRAGKSKRQSTREESPECESAADREAPSGACHLAADTRTSVRGEGARCQAGCHRRSAGLLIWLLLAAVPIVRREPNQRVLFLVSERSFIKLLVIFSFQNGALDWRRTSHATSIDRHASRLRAFSRVH